MNYVYISEALMNDLERMCGGGGWCDSLANAHSTVNMFALLSELASFHIFLGQWLKYFLNFGVTVPES